MINPSIDLYFKTSRCSNLVGMGLDLSWDPQSLGGGRNLKNASVSYLGEYENIILRYDVRIRYLRK